MQDKIVIKGARVNNLKNIDIEIPKNKLVVVTGVSGSGKSSLVNEILHKSLARKLNRARIVPGKHKKIEGVEQLDKIIDIDQSPIGRTPSATHNHHIEAVHPAIAASFPVLSSYLTGSLQQ